MKHIIFDLDLTLVDSTIAEDARSRRNWPLAYSLIPSFTLYSGITDIFDFIRTNAIHAAIVSTSPSAYVQRVVSFFNMPIKTIVGYHDAPRKPSPAGMLLAMQRIGATPENTISCGDRVIDIQASNAAGITSLACLWGSTEKELLLKSNASSIIYSPIDIITFIQ